MRNLIAFLWCLSLLAVGCGRPRSPGPPVPKTTEISASANTGTVAPVESNLDESDWPMWRGPNADGVGIGPDVPVKWSDAKNVVWKAKIPGRGHSSPVIVGDRIFLETADEQKQTQSVLCLDRKNGRQIWQQKLFEGNLETQMHPENTQATSTPVCDGKRLYALFLNDRKIWATALDMDGKQVWQTEVGSFAAKFGYSASPTLYKSALFLAADHQQGGFIARINCADGKIVWRKQRPELSSYASPRVITLGGKDQLVICGCHVMASFDPLTGEQLWSTKGTAEAGVGLPVTNGSLVIASAGYPQKETMALKADGTVAWRNSDNSYVPSLLALDGYVYMVNDGIVRCYAVESGREMWKHRIGGNFRVSPVASGGNIFTTDMSGKTTVFRANSTKYELVAENQLGTEGFASPGISRGHLFLRVADTNNGPRQEWLYCIGTSP